MFSFLFYIIIYYYVHIEKKSAVQMEVLHELAKGPFKNNFTFVHNSLFEDW